MTPLSSPWGRCLDHSQRNVRFLEHGNELLAGLDQLHGVCMKSEFGGITFNRREHEKRRDVRPRMPSTVMQSREDLIGKNIVVVGLGASGQAAVKLALARGANVIAVDTKSSVQQPEVDSSMASRLQVELGPHRRETFREASLLVISPGVSAAQSDIAFAIQAGVPAISELSFAAEALPKSIKIAAVSGTNGKSTVATFAGQMLCHGGVRTFVGGNLGTPLSSAALQCLAFPAEDPPFHAAVVEVSSYQMELPGTFCPKVAVILNLTPDHLERHKTMENYGLVKCRLFSQMDSSSLAILPQSDSFLRKLAVHSGHKGTRAWLGGLPGVQLDSQARRAFVMVPTTGVKAGLYLSALKAVGSHNAHNAGTAALLALALDVGLTEESIQDAIPDVSPPPHRMEIVHEDEQRVLWVNDSKATNVDATAVGIKGIIGRKAVVLIGGLAKDIGWVVGSLHSFVLYREKSYPHFHSGGNIIVVMGENLGFDRLVNVLDSHRAVILFGASGKQIEQELQDAAISVPCVRAVSMKDAVNLARSFAKPGDAVILSPACASFDEFQNFEHRGQVFTDLAKMPVT